MVIRIWDAHATIAAPHLDGLKVGDRVNVVFKKDDGKNMARSVTVE